MIRNTSIEPADVEYLKTPPMRKLVVQLIARTGIATRELLRENDRPMPLGVGDTALSDDALLDAMMARPILIDRPLIVSPLGVRLCRPSEAMFELVPSAQRPAC